MKRFIFGLILAHFMVGTHASDTFRDSEDKCKVAYQKDTLFGRVYEPKRQERKILAKKNYELVSFNESDFLISVKRRPELGLRIPILGQFQFSIFDKRGNEISHVALGEGHRLLAHLRAAPTCANLRRSLEGKN